MQEGLLPRVGRRGPRTRYPGLVRDRLLFIRRVREAEEAGEVSAVSLSDMRVVFERVSPGLIARVADGEIAVTPELVERASTAFRLPEMRRAVLARRVMAREGRAEEPRLHAPVETKEDLRDVLRELQDRARERVVRSRSSMDTWTRIEITPEIEVSVRGITDEDRGLVERVRRAIWRLVGERGAE